MATRDAGLKGSPLSFREYGQHSCGTDLVLYFQGPSVVWCQRIPWGQRPGSGLETLLLETEVLEVDLSVWLSTRGFCTSRKRWKGSYSSPSGVLVSARIMFVQLHTHVLFLAEAPLFILWRYRKDGWVKYRTKRMEIIYHQKCVCKRPVSRQGGWLTPQCVIKSIEEKVNENWRSSSCYGW